METIPCNFGRNQSAPLDPIYTGMQTKRKRTEFDIKKVFRPHGYGSINVSLHTRPLDPLETL